MIDWLADWLSFEINNNNIKMTIFQMSPYSYQMTSDTKDLDSAKTFLQ